MNTRESIEGTRLQHAPCGAHRKALAIGLLSLAMTACGGGSDSDGQASSSSSAGSSSSGGTGGTSDGSNGSSSVTLKPVVYSADQDVYETYELYTSNPNAPGASIKLNPALVAGGDVDEFLVSPTGDKVLYTADQDIYGRYELYMVNLAQPGVATKVSAPLSPNRDVRDFIISSDGTKVAYRADSDVDDVWELFIVDLAQPGAVTKLNGTLAAGGYVRGGYLFDPSGTKVAYRADQAVFDTVELHLVNVASPGASQQVNPALASGGNVYEQFKFSPNGAYLAYIADQEIDQKLELYAVDVSALGASSKLNGAMVAAGDVCNFTFSPDSTRVAYCADQDVDGVKELYTTALSSPGSSVKLNPPLVANGHVTAGYEFGPDSSYLLYAAAQDDANRIDLYRVDIASPGVTTKLNGTLVSGGSVDHFAIRADGARVAYMANQESATIWELYEVDTAGGSAAKLSPAMAGRGLWWFDYQGSTHIVYVAEQDTAAAQLYRVDVATPGVSTRLNGPLVAGGEVWRYGLVP